MSIDSMENVQDVHGIYGLSTDGQAGLFCVIPGSKPRRPVFSRRGSCTMIQYHMTHDRCGTVITNPLYDDFPLGTSEDLSACYVNTLSENVWSGW